MSDYLLSIPSEVYDHARQIAEETAQPVDQLMIDYLRTLSSPIPELPPDEEAELAALKSLSNDTLRTIAREQLPGDIQSKMQALMDRNSAGTITPEEFGDLEQLVERGNRLMVRKAEAAGILIERGQSFSQRDFMAH